jgi:PAS domain S-box-containing protein
MDNWFDCQEIFNNINNGIAVYQATDNGHDFIFKDINQAVERIENIKKEDIIGKKITEIFPGVKKFGLFKILQDVYKTGKTMSLPLSYYEDKRIKGWRENLVVRLSSGEVAAIYQNLTEKKMEDDKMTELESYYRLITENTSDLISIITLSLDPKFLFVSPFCKNMLGYDSASLIGTPAFRDIHPEDKKNILLNFGSVVKDALLKKATVLNSCMSYRIKHKNGNWRFLESTANIVGNKILLISRDVTEKKNYEKRLENAAAEWKETFDALPDGVSIHSENFDILRSNKALWDILGKTKDQILTHKCYEIFHNKNMPINGCVLNQSKKSGRQESIEYFEPTLDRWIMIACAPIRDQDGRISKYIHIIQDITERKKAEREVASKMEMMEKMNSLGVDRELKMVELKKKIKELEKKLSPESL